MRSLAAAQLALALAVSVPALAGVPHLLKDVNPDRIPGSSNPRFLGRVGARAVIVAEDGTGNDEPWVTDGTPAGTFRLSFDGPALDLRQGIALGGLALFANGDAVLGSELWRSDLSRAGTRPVLDLAAGLVGADSLPASFMSLGADALFVADDAAGGQLGLWRSDGSEAGSRLVAPLGLRQEVKNVWADTGQRTCFGLGSGLWCTDQSGRELWVSDGTAAGTQLVRDLTPGEGDGPFLSTFVPAGNVAYFSFGGFGEAIWRSDGTAAGTVPVLETSQVPGAQAVFPHDLVEGQLHLFVQSTDPAVAGTYLTDGSLASLRRVLPEVPPAFGLSGLDGKLLWTVSPNAAIQVSDGTLESARPLLDEHGEPVVGLLILTRLGSRLLLTNYAGDELWETDGTPAGTRKIEPLLPRIGAVRQFLVTGGRFYFPALDREHGIEPWVLPGEGQ